MNTFKIILRVPFSAKQGQGGAILSQDASPFATSSQFIFSEFSCFRSPLGKTTGFVGCSVSHSGSRNPLSRIPHQMLGLLIFRSPFGKTTETLGKSFAGHRSPLPRQPNSDVGTSHTPSLLLKKNPTGTKYILHRLSPQISGIPFCSFSITHFRRFVNGFWGISMFYIQGL